MTEVAFFNLIKLVTPLHYLFFAALIIIIIFFFAVLFFAEPDNRHQVWVEETRDTYMAVLFCYYLRNPHFSWALAACLLLLYMIWFRGSICSCPPSGAGRGRLACQITGCAEEHSGVRKGSLCAVIVQMSFRSVCRRWLCWPFAFKICVWVWLHSSVAGFQSVDKMPWVCVLRCIFCQWLSEVL